MSQARNTRLAAWSPYHDDLVVDTSLGILFQSQAVGAMTHTLHHASILPPCCLAVCNNLCFAWRCKLLINELLSTWLSSWTDLSYNS